MTNIKLNSISTNYITPFKPTDTFKYALETMKEKAISSIIVVNNQQHPIGIFTEYDALKMISANIDKQTPINEIMTTNVFTVKDDLYVHDAYVLMEQKNYRHVVVVNSDNVYMGVVTEGDFLRHIGFEDLSKSKPVKDVMSDSILTVNPDISLKEAATLMTKNRCDYAIVLQEKTPTKIIKEREITHYFTTNNIETSPNVSVLSNTQMFTVDKDSSLSDASLIMRNKGVHQLVVTDQNKHLIGLITRHDILKAIHGAYFDYLLETIKIKSENERALIKQQKELEKLANYDQLTNLPNRLFFQAYLEKSIAKAIRSDKTLGIIILDIDRFKDINDSYGHTVGDELLKQISTRLTNIIRAGDLVAKIGGDEFGIILEDLTNAEDIAQVSRKILQNISEVYTLPNRIQVHVKASAGIVLAPIDTQNVEQAIQYADSALYQAKADGRGIYKFYTDEMTQKAMQKLAYETALRDALKNGELEVYYQPQVNFDTKKIVGAEALLRWNYQNKYKISPETFIPIAEDTGLINELGEWVVNQVCIQGKRWQDDGHDITLAVNISPNQIKYQNLTELINDALDISGFSPQNFEIEITESSLMQREDETVEVLNKLRSKGIRLAIDDFGIGYSSLSYLKKFPIDILKIDKSFIEDIPSKEDDVAIVIAIIELGKALGYKVLAEGIEYQKQLEFLEEKGCHLYQGFIKSKPIPATEFEELLREQSS